MHSPPRTQTLDPDESLGRAIALVSIGVGISLSLAKVVIGLRAGSAAVVSDGVEAAGDVLSSAIVYAGLWLASRPPDAEHPYGHGRYETLAGLAVGALLLLTGAGILWHGFNSHSPQAPVQAFAVYPLIAAVICKVTLSITKFQIGRRIDSSGLQADAWHDMTDLLSTFVAFSAVLLALIDPVQFRGADRAGGLVIGVIILALSIQVVRRTVDSLLDTMPKQEKVEEIRRAALTVPGALGVEKCFARRTGLKYHVDLHLEVDPDLTVRQSHAIATEVKAAVKARLRWVADVLIHVEPSGMLAEVEPARLHR